MDRRGEWEPVPMYIPVPPTEPPPDKNPGNQDNPKEQPEMGEEVTVKEHGNTVINGEDRREDDREWNPFKSDQEM